MKYDPPFEQLKAWFYAERDSGFGFDQCVKIVDIVLNGRAYTEMEKLEVLSRKAITLYGRARDERNADPLHALTDFREALKLNLACLIKSDQLGLPSVQKLYIYCRNTLFSLAQFAFAIGQYEDLFRSIAEIAAINGVKLDCLEEPLLYTIQSLQDVKQSTGELHRVKNKLEQLSKSVCKPALWVEGQSRSRVSEAFDKALKRLNARVREVHKRT